jgi:hypothetical protein
VEHYKNATITDGFFGWHKQKVPKQVFFQRVLFLNGYQGRGGGYLCTVAYRAHNSVVEDPIQEWIFFMLRLGDKVITDVRHPF